MSFTIKKPETEDFYNRLSRNNIPGSSFILKFGANPSIQSGVAEDIWDGGGTYAFPTAARIHDLVSTEVGDTQDIEIFGLDENFLEINEIVTLTGTTNAATTNSYTSIHRMINRSSTDLAGTVTATARTDATVTAQINVGNNQTLMAIYKVPINKRAYILDVYAAVNRTGGSSVSCLFDLTIRPDGEVYQVKRRFGSILSGSSFVDLPFRVPRPVDPCSEIKIRASANANSTIVSGGFDIILVDI